MADAEPRRSGRATKGKHSKLAEDNEPPAPPEKKSRGRKDKQAEGSTPQDDDGSNDDVIRCVCGATQEDENDTKDFVQCEKCLVWQHNLCLGITKKQLPEHYFCEQCRPDMHSVFLEKIARGERPWERKGRKSTGRRSVGGRSRKDGYDGASVEATPSVAGGTPAPDGGRRESLQGSEAPTTTQVTIQEDNRGQPMDVDTNPPVAPSRDSTVDAPDRKSEEVASESSQTKKRKARESQVDLSIDTSRAMAADQEPQSAEPKTPRRPSASATTPLTAKPKDTGRSTKKRKMSEAGAGSPPRTFSLDNTRKNAGELLQNKLNEIANKKGDEMGIPPVRRTPEFTMDLAGQIELHVYNAHMQNPDLYKRQATNIALNMSRNDDLAKNILMGFVTPEQLALMTVEEMASKEMQKRNEELRRENEKQHILRAEDETGPRIRRTHKGEEFVGDEDIDFQPQPSVKTESAGNQKSPSTDDNAMSPTSGTPGDGTQRKFSVDNVWNKIEPSATPGHRPSFSNSLPHASPSLSRPGVNNPKLAKFDADIDNLLSNDGDGAGTPPYSPAPEDALDSQEWRGAVRMAGTADFEAIARLVAGSDCGPTANWTVLLQQSITVDGRIMIDRASDYLSGLRYSKSNMISVLSISPRDALEGTVQFNKLFDYFKVKNRFGVISQRAISAIRDVYLVPVDRDEKLPAFFDNIEPKVIPEVPRQDRLILVIFVVNKAELASVKARQASAVDTQAIKPPTPIQQGQGSPPNYSTPPVGYTPQPPPPSAYSAPTPLQQPQHPSAFPPQQQPPPPQPQTAFPPLPPQQGPPRSASGKTFTFKPWKELENSLPYLEDQQIDLLNALVARYPEAATDPQLLSDLLMHSGAAGVGA